MACALQEIKLDDDHKGFKPIVYMFYQLAVLLSVCQQLI